MKRLTLAASVTLAISVPAVAAAQSVTPQHARKYAHLYHQVAAKMGHRAPGRNIVRWGLAANKPATDVQVLTSIGVLERMLAPPAAVTPATVTPVADTQVQSLADTQANPVANTQVDQVANSQVNSPVTQTSNAGASAAPSGSPLPACTWQPESGGNPSAVNPSSGAGGYYQIMPSTWAAYGGSGAPQSAPMSEQTAIAQKIYQSQGPGAWTNC
jgi:hypothetical protein